MERAIFAGGCFWCMVQPFDTLPGIESVISGYTGGNQENPTYLEVKSGTTGHTEAVEIIFDPTLISYRELVEIYWQQTDPTDAFGQFEDRGSSYRPVIYYFDEKQRETAEESKKHLQSSGHFDQPIVTQIESAVTFYPAEPEHQAYYQRNPENYQKNAAKRKQFIAEFW
ncbi:peptide-methionine (S)-S-oxide reductase MsrA [Enterococcus pseudoavium]|uniref:peptide-methionine (S)-S-oxide reductase MsrA n=1 Tax=Enterococcus pseudoavium TaxID=44007 RepID=UPI003F95225F